MYWILIILLIVIAIIFIPIKIHIKYEDTSNDTINIQNSNLKSNDKNKKKYNKINNYIKIYLLYIFPIINVNLDKMKEKKSKQKILKESKSVNNSKKNISSNKHYILNAIFDTMEKSFTNKKKRKNSIKIEDVIKILKTVYFERFFLKIGINFDNPIINSYAIATFNMLLCMYINKNIDNFNMSQLYYNTYISESVYKFNINSILRIKVADNISVILKVIFRYFKNIKETKNNKRKVEIKNGRKTSNRKSNDDCHDIFRKYD